MVVGLKRVGLADGIPSTDLRCECGNHYLSTRAIWGLEVISRKLSGAEKVPTFSKLRPKRISKNVEHKQKKISQSLCFLNLITYNSYHTLACASPGRTLLGILLRARSAGLLIFVTKLSVLLIFAEAKGFLRPDQVCGKLQPVPDRRSLYSYLARLRAQGLLERGHNPRRGWLSYRLTSRGEERIAYLRAQRS
jgi:hypothetical protein